MPSHLTDNVLSYAHRDFAAIRESSTVAEALASVKESKLESRIVYFYVVDDDGRLKGVLPTRELLLGAPEASIGGLMSPRVVSIPESATLLDACEQFMLHRLLALPVLDEEGRIVGVVDVDKYTEELRELDIREQSEDIFQLIGVRLAEARRAPLHRQFMQRFPWLLCNIGGGLACAFIAGFFENVLQQVLLLALFIPVVLALAESVSIQSLTLTLQGQVGRQIEWRRVWQALLSELPLGIALGAACGSLIGLAAWLWQGNPLAAACIFVSITLAITTATVLGLLVPSILMATQKDPKLASGPIALAATDMLTMVFYLGLASWVLL